MSNIFFSFLVVVIISDDITNLFVGISSQYNPVRFLKLQWIRMSMPFPNDMIHHQKISKWSELITKGIGHIKYFCIIELSFLFIFKNLKYMCSEIWPYLTCFPSPNLYPSMCPPSNFMSSFLMNNCLSPTNTAHMPMDMGPYTGAWETYEWGHLGNRKVLSPAAMDWFSIAVW